ncbi:MAG: 1-aminocyclopropane-1-carboxylate deaminase/D-cysteine desulfhydrase [Flavobacteriales bacterium]|nr:1-aminocyclopropane-1-carboxylate deaminase/D-cysteine desulfhydrase [Flavobacteriales bacterium]
MFNEETPIEQIFHPDLEDSKVELWMKRDDLIHEEVSGNKWRKLKYYVEKAKTRDGIVTFGGAYSNHIAATAAAGKLLNMKTIGIIRGEELNETSNETLAKAAKDGMTLVFVSREEYGYKYDQAYHKQIRLEYGDVVIVPEGGGGYEGMVGASEIIKGHGDFDLFSVACGTGATLAGMTIALKGHQRVVGFPALKGDFMKEEVNQLLNTYFLNPEIYKDYQDDFYIVNDYHFGGYAKVNDELISFIREFYSHTNIKLDPIYTGKMMFGLLDQIKKQKIYSGQKVLAIHTGGMQGVSGVEAKIKDVIFR